MGIVTPLAKTHAKVTVYVNGNSNYYDQGISQTQNKPSADVGIDYTFSNGLFLGNWNSNVSRTMYPRGYGLETDFYAGYNQDFDKGPIEAGFTSQIYPGAKTETGIRYDSFMVYVGAQKGPLKLRFNQSIGRRYSGIKGITRYYQSELTVPIRPWVKFNMHVNYLTSPLGRNYNYYDTRTGFVFPMLGGELSVYYRKNIMKQANKEFNTLKDVKLYTNQLSISYGYTYAF